MADSHDAFLTLLDQGFVPTGHNLREWASTDVDELDQLAGSLDGHADSPQPAEDFDVAALPYDVRCDRDLLRAFAAEADTPRGGH